MQKSKFVIYLSNGQGRGSAFNFVSDPLEGPFAAYERFV